MEYPVKASGEAARTYPTCRTHVGVSRRELKAFWFRVQYARRVEVIVMTAPSLQNALDRLELAQAGRLAYDRRSPRIIRLTALHPDTRDPAFNAFLDTVLRIENDRGTAKPVDRFGAPSP